MGGKRGIEEVEEDYSKTKPTSSTQQSKDNNNKKPKYQDTTTKQIQVLETTKDDHRLHRSPSPSPLKGVIACLTGLTPDEKEHLHRTIESLGGRFTRELLSNENTHLIAMTNYGAKYELAKSCHPRIQIVTPLWIQECVQQQRHVKEDSFSLIKTTTDMAVRGDGTTTTTTTTEPGDDNHDEIVVNNNNNNIMKETQSSLKQPQTQTTKTILTPTTTLSDQIDNLLLLQTDANNNNTTTTTSSIFASCQFFLLGFDIETKEDDVDEDDNEDDNDTNQQNYCSPLQIKLGKLIRRGKGTIYWDIHPSITHIIVHDNCHDSLRNAATIVTTHHFNRPIAVSTNWVIESWKIQTLKKPQDFPPIIIQPRLPPEMPVVDPKRGYTTTTSSSNITTQNRTKNHRGATTTTTSALTTSSSSVFRGCMFAVVRIAPPTWAVDFDSQQQEQLIKRNGGQMISLKLLDALRGDAVRQSQQRNNNNNNQDNNKRTCYVVCWGGFSQTHLDLNPILSQLQRHNLCQLTLVTPLWLSTCVDVQKRVPPHRLPKLFVPQPWLLRRLLRSSSTDTTTATTATSDNPSDDNINNNNNKTLKQQQVKSVAVPSSSLSSSSSNNICISVTGLSNTERAAIRQLLQAIGATYDTGMGDSCTHLICRDLKKNNGTTDTSNRGPKMERALQRGLPIVDMDWVYRVAQHGID